MSFEKTSTAKLWSSPIDLLRSVLSFSQSIFAEWIVYALVFHSMSAIVTFFLFLPADCLNGYSKGDLGRGVLVDFHNCFFAIPFDIIRFSVFPLQTRVILIGLWTFTARPSLVLAGLIVGKRLPAYTFPAENCSPIRWLFEFFCSFANRHHYVIPDGELYARQILRLVGARVAVSSRKLGTILPEEFEELFEFAHVFHTAVGRFLKRETTNPPLWFPTLNIGEHTRYQCAFEILPRTSDGQPQYHIRYPSDAVDPSPSQHGKETTPGRLGWKSLGSDVRSFLYMYNFTVWYWILRPCSDLMAVCLPTAFDEATAGVQEWYDKNVLPSLRDPK